MCNVAWKILRGAVVASTEIVTLGAVAAYPVTDVKRTQNTPRIFENFILARPSICCELILRRRNFNYSSRRMRRYRGRWVWFGCVRENFLTSHTGEIECRDPSTAMSCTSWTTSSLRMTREKVMRQQRGWYDSAECRGAGSSSRLKGSTERARARRC